MNPRTKLQVGKKRLMTGNCSDVQPSAKLKELANSKSSEKTISGRSLDREFSDR